MQTLQSNNRPSAVDFIYNHYADLNSRDYETTWQRLSPNFSSALNYSDDINWWDTVAKIRLQDVALISQNDSNARIKISIIYVMNDGRNITDKKPFINLIWDNYADMWLIDSKQ